MSKFISFRKVEVTNPTNGELVTKLHVVHADGHSYTLLTDLSVDEIKAQRAELLSKVVLCDGEFGTYAMFTRATIKEEF